MVVNVCILNLRDGGRPAFDAHCVDTYGMSGEIRVDIRHMVVVDAKQPING